jgi:D-serine deaminase-like pyridoxal phosphate-dependent protein
MAMQIESLDTPAILIDLDIMDRNLSRVADYARLHKLRLRPHTKTHKIPALGARQIALGAAGLTVAKVGEAEVMQRSTPDLLVAYPVIGRSKLDRLMRVDTDITVSLDSAEAAGQLSQAAQSAGRTIGVLAEFDAGLHRVGVPVGQRLHELVRSILELPGLDFRGIAFYPGHLKDAASPVDEMSASVQHALGQVRATGAEARIVSGGSTPLLWRSHEVQGINEIRPGTYIFNDRNTVESNACQWDDCAATILCTVVSTAVDGQMIIDGGSKTFSSDRTSIAPGFGRVTEAPAAVFEKMNEEHGYVNLAGVDRKFSIGDRVHVIPNHVCVAMNLHEQVYGVRNGRVDEVWKVEGRGKLQ